MQTSSTARANWIKVTPCISDLRVLTSLGARHSQCKPVLVRVIV